jgi:hypothetical protein
MLQIEKTRINQATDDMKDVLSPLIADPLMIFEGRLVSIEKKLDYTYRSIKARCLVPIFRIEVGW